MDTETYSDHKEPENMKYTFYGSQTSLLVYPEFRPQ